MIKLPKIRVPGAKGKELKEIQARYEKKVADWAKFLADDYDFDWSSILRVLRFKIARHSDHMKGHRFFDGWEEVAAEMDDVCARIDRVLTHDYEEEHLKPYYAKYGRPEFVLSPPRKDGSVEGRSVYPNGKKSTKAMMKQFIKACVSAEEQKQAEVEALFSKISKNLIQKWWC